MIIMIIMIILYCIYICNVINNNKNIIFAIVSAIFLFFDFLLRRTFKQKKTNELIC